MFYNLKCYDSPTHLLIAQCHWSPLQFQSIGSASVWIFRGAEGKTQHFHWERARLRRRGLTLPGWTWHDFHKRELSWAELSLKLPIVIQMKDSHTAVQRKDTRGGNRGCVFERLQCTSTHTKTPVVQKDFDCCCIALDAFLISVLSGIKCRKWYFPLWKFLHFAFSLHVSEGKRGPWLRSPLKSQIDSPRAKQTSQNTNLKQHCKTKNKILFAKNNVRISTHI